MTSASGVLPHPARKGSGVDVLDIQLRTRMSPVAEDTRGAFALAGEHLGAVHARVIVDRHMQVVPASPWASGIPSLRIRFPGAKTRPRRLTSMWIRTPAPSRAERGGTFMG